LALVDERAQVPVLEAEAQLQLSGASSGFADVEYV
jgi:hypothetical protein